MISPVDRLTEWIREELVVEAGLSPDEAASATDACLADLRELVARPHVGNPNVVDHLVSAAASAVSSARATHRCPGGKGWWVREGARARMEVAAGRFAQAWAAQAESLSGPADIDVDFNWPESKMFVAELPVGAQEGDRVKLGDGEGNRMDATVIRRQGRLGVEADPGSFRNPTDDLWSDAWEAAKALAEAS